MIIIDRFESEYAVVEIDGKICNVSKSQISGDVAEGDILVFRDGFYITDAEKTAERRMKMRARQSRLFDK